MMKMRIILLLVFVGFSYGLNNGLGRTPQMGKWEKNKLSTLHTKKKNDTIRSKEHASSYVSSILILKAKRLKLSSLS